MGKKILITGGNTSFIGKHLAKVLIKNGHSVSNEYFDITVPLEISKILEKAQFDFVFHLAGISHNLVCEENPVEAYRVNVIGTQFLIEAINEYQTSAKIIFPSSAYVYDFSKLSNKLKIDEDFPIGPKTVYAKSKLLCEDLLRIAFTRWGTKSLILRLFNHTHKSQDPSFFLPGFYQQLMNQSSDVISVGSLTVQRDIGLIQDLINELGLMTELEDHVFDSSVFNLCAGNDFFFVRIGPGAGKNNSLKKEIVVDPKRIRKNDPPYISGDMIRLSRVLKTVRPRRSLSEFVNLFWPMFNYLFASLQS
ncbi:MAG: SDR family oxidoreductase [Bdellovibrionales bacterium]|nr:SDR family oxidoreductase [Bdellovibrionales bacterium]